MAINDNERQISLNSRITCLCVFVVFMRIVLIRSQRCHIQLHPVVLSQNVSRLHSSFYRSSLGHCIPYGYLWGLLKETNGVNCLIVAMFRCELGIGPR